MNREETLTLLREAHREPIAEAHYAAVRARVFSRLATERRPWWRMWAYGFAGVAVAVVMLAVVGRTPWSARRPLAPLLAQQNRPLESPERPAGGAAADQGVRPTFAASTVGRRKRLPHRTTAARAAYRVVGPPSLRPLVVKLVTDDPNIVIYWISGE
jgi:hypothetical protein